MKEEIIRALIHDENEMTNHRMNWFLILQGFLFAGIAFAWDKNVGLCLVFSFVGIFSSLSVGILLHFGILAIRNLQKYCQAEIIGRRHEETKIFIHLLLPWNFLPILFMLA